MIDSQTGIPNLNGQDKPPQGPFIHSVLKMGLEQIQTLSDSLMAIQPSKYEVEKDIIASLALLMHQKIHDIKGLIDEMTQERRSWGLD